MAMAFALRNLETQSRGNLHAHPRMDVPHGIFYVAHSRVKNFALGMYSCVFVLFVWRQFCC